MDRTPRALLAALLFVVAASAVAQDYAVVYEDPADNGVKVRVPTIMSRTNAGLQWALTSRGRAVAYNSSTPLPSDQPDRYLVFPFHQFQEQPTRDDPANPLDPYGFVYSEVRIDPKTGEFLEDPNAPGMSVVERYAFKWPDYVLWNNLRVNMFMQQIQGGQLQVPNGADPRAFAEWTHYYEQLGLWERYVEQFILLEPIQAPRPDSPKTIRENMDAYYDAIIDQRDQVSERLHRRMIDFFNRLESRREERQRYDEWKAEQRSELMEFAQMWQRRRAGTEVVVEGQPFIISSEPMENPPLDRLPVVNPSSQITPYDLLDEKGQVKSLRDE